MNLFGLLGGLFTTKKIEEVVDKGTPSVLGMGASLAGGYIVAETIDDLMDDDSEEDEDYD